MIIDDDDDVDDDDDDVVVVVVAAVVWGAGAGGLLWYLWVPMCWRWSLFAGSRRDGCKYDDTMRMRITNMLTMTMMMGATGPAEELLCHG